MKTALKKVLAIVLALSMLSIFSVLCSGADETTTSASLSHIVSYPKNHVGYSIVPVNADGSAIAEGTATFYVKDGGSFSFKIEVSQGYSYEKSAASEYKSDWTTIRYYETGKTYGSLDILGGDEGLEKAGFHSLEPDANGVYTITNITTDTTVDALHVKKSGYSNITGFLRALFAVISDLFQAIAKTFNIKFTTKATTAVTTTVKV